MANVTVTRADGSTETIALTDKKEDGHEYMSFKCSDGVTRYALLGESTDSKASHLWIEKDGVKKYCLKDSTTTIQSGTRFIFSKNNNMGPVNLVIGSNTYTLEGYNSYSSLFDIHSNVTFDINIAYKNGITLADFDTTGELGNFLRNATLTLTRESDGYGFRWSGSVGSIVGSIGSNGLGQGTWYYGEGSATFETTDSTSLDWYTIFTNLKTAYNNGDNLVVEFTAKA